MRKIFSKALCLMLTIMMVSTMLVQASTTDVIMETVHEETNIVDATGYFQVDTGWTAAPVTFADGKWTMKHASDGNHGINFHILKDSDLLKKIKDLDNVVYTVSFDVHKADMDQDFTVFSLGYGNTPAESSNIVIKDSSDSNTLNISGPSSQYIYAPWTDNNTATCTLIYNSATKEMSVKAEGHNAVIKSTLKNTVNSSSSTGYGIRLKTSINTAGQISVSNVSMKVEQPSDKVVEENVSDKFMGKLAENKNITAATTGDLQVIQWQKDTLTTDSGKFTLTTNGSGKNRGIILGLPKNSSLKNTVDMTKVVYTACFKLHRGDRGADFTVEVLGYNSTSVESTGIVFLNAETEDGKFKFNTSGAEGTAAWNQDGTVDCTLTYNAETKVATVKVGEAEISKTLTGDYNASNEAAAYGFRIKGPSSGNTTISISDVSLKVEQPIELTVKGNKISMPLYKPAGSSDKLIIACYDNSGDFISAEIKDVGEWTSDNIANKQYEFTTSLTGNVRIFLWEDFSILTPLIDSLEHSI